MSHGFAACASRLKPFLPCSLFLSLDFSEICTSSEESAVPVCTTDVSDCFKTLCPTVGFSAHARRSKDFSTVFCTKTPFVYYESSIIQTSILKIDKGFT